VSLGRRILRFLKAGRNNRLGGPVLKIDWELFTVRPVRSILVAVAEAAGDEREEMAA